MSTLAVGQIRKFTGKYCFPHQLRIDRIEGDRTVVFGNCCGGDAAVEVAHEHATHNLHAETVLISPPIPEPAPELCAYPGCDELLSHNVHRCTRYCTNFGIDRCPRNTMRCHDFIAPQAKPLIAKPLIAKPTDVYAGPPITGAAKPVLREPLPVEVMLAVCGLCGRGYIDAAEHADWHVRITPCMTIPATAENTRSLRERGPSAVAAAPGIEPWRPTVDDWDLLADAVEGWRR